MTTRDTLLSIVIVSWNTQDILRRCLDSIRTAAPPLGFDVIIVDNASTDGSPDMVSSEFPEFTVIRNKENLGFAAANNIGIQRAVAGFVMLLNPDTELCPGTVARMSSFAREHPNVGIIGPRLVMPDGQLQKSGRRFPTFMGEFLSVTRLSRVFKSFHDRNVGWGREDFDAITEVDEVSGACMLIRRSALDEIGLLDERFFMYYEDVDLCCRLKKAGWKVVYMGEGAVVHAWAQSALKMGVLRANGMMYRSQYLYFLKHHGPVQAVILRMLSLLLLGVMRVKYAVIPPRANGKEVSA